MKSFLKTLGLAFGIALGLSMAEIERAPTRPGAKGAEPAVVEGMSAADTQLIPNKTGRVMLRITAGAEEIAVTVVTPPTDQDGNAIADLVNNIAATKTEVMGPFNPSLYNNALGQLEVKLNKVTGVKMEVYLAE